MGQTTFSGPIRSLNGFIGPTIAVTPLALTAAALALTPEHAGETIVLNRAAGQALTLPAAMGTGAVYRFFVQTTITSNSTTIKVANSTDVMQGFAVVLQDGGDTVVGFETAADSDTITFNGTTTGGIRGALVELEDVASGLWSVNVRGAATGAEVTPFSATV